MEILLYTVLILCVSGAVILTARLLCYQKQVRHLIRELKLMEETDTKGKLTSAVHIGRTEEAISIMNRVLDKERRQTEELKKENRSYRESITGISHDIRTPLTSVKGYVQMLSNPKAQEERKVEYLTIIERRLQDLTEMLDMLFEYARIEAGEIELMSERLNVRNLFADTVSLFYEDFTAKECEPEVTLPQGPCYMQGDRHAFVRIVENLAKNALVHGTGGYRFSLSEEGGHIRILVSNRTESIEAQDIDRIFDRFYTTDLSRSRKTTGLGLAIVKEFARQMGGTAEASLEGELFTITVTFDAVNF